MVDHSGHRARLRELYIKEGGKNFAAHNLLELLLFYAIPRRDTNDIAHALLKRFGNVGNVLDASVEELCQVNGININSATLIKLVAEIGGRYCRDDLNSYIRFYTYEEMGEFLQNQFLGVKRERVIAMYLDNSGRLLKLAVACEGGVSSARFDIRSIASNAMALDAGAVVIAHNHPGGSSFPSPEDLDATRQMRRVLAMAAIDLIEHYVVAEDGTTRLLPKCCEEDKTEVRQYFSFKDRT